MRERDIKEAPPSKRWDSCETKKNNFNVSEGYKERVRERNEEKVFLCTKTFPPKFVVRDINFPACLCI
jgi:hypothetical protein